MKLSSSVCAQGVLRAHAGSAGYTFGASGYWKAPWHQLPVAVAHVTSLSGALSCATGSAPTRPGPSHALLGVRGQRAARVLLAHGPAVALEHPLRGAEAALASRAREAARGVVDLRLSALRCLPRIASPHVVQRSAAARKHGSQTG